MKNLSYVLTVIAFLTFSFSQAQKRYLTGNEIPVKISTYVQKNFPGSTIQKVKEEKKPLKTEYEVKLTPKMELEFDTKFNITEIESKNGVPFQVLPRKVRKYLTENYPDKKVKEWKSKPEGQKVKLIKGPKLYFDNNGKFVAAK